MSLNQAVYSMTGFARLEQNKMVCEIKGLNHRYFDLNLKLCDYCKPFENEIRQLTKKVVKRGKLEISLRFQPLPSHDETSHIETSNNGFGHDEISDNQPSFNINHALLDQLISACELVTDLTKNRNFKVQAINQIDLLQFPGVLAEIKVTSEVKFETIKDCVVETLNIFNQHRNNEGNALATFIQNRLSKINELVVETHNEMENSDSHYINTMKQRADKLQVKVDAERLEQELVILLQKIDVAEELERIKIHVIETDRVLENKKAIAIGRKLDFLMQELNREANTLSSKSISSNVSANAIELKVLIEQMREQVQNIE